MSGDEKRQFVEAVIQHVSDLRQEYGRNQQIITNGQWRPDNGPSLEGLKATNEWLVKVIMGSQFLLDFYERSENEFPRYLIWVIVITSVAATIVGSLLLSYLANGGGH